MTTPQTLSLLLLGLVLVLAIWRRMNIGVLALGAAFVMLLVTGGEAKALYKSSFPGDLVVLIAGVSLLFAHLERSGALRWFVDRVYAAIGDRTALLPWAGFVIAAALSSAGAFSTAPIALLVPTIAHLCVRYRKSFYVCELAVVIGANCAGLSPLNPTGALVHTVADKYHASYPVWGVWAVSLVVAAVVVAALQIIDAALQRRGRVHIVMPAPAELEVAESETHTPARRGYAIASGLALVAFVLLVLFAKTDVGLTAMALVTVLQFVFRPAEGLLLHRIPWNSILLLAGLLTYLGILDSVGTMKAIEHGLSGLGTGALLVFVLAYMTALLCNIESSTLGVLGLMMPLVFTAFGTSSALFWIVAAVAVPAALMVMNPIHVAGTLIIGNSAEADQPILFRRLLGTAVTLAVIAPGVLAVVPALAVGL